MLESFKITAEKLKRHLKIHVNLPNSYLDDDLSYPAIISLDGQLMFNFINEDTKKMDVAKDFIDRPYILIALHSPKIPAWRISELNPYYNGSDKTVETVLSYIYFDYIVMDLIPLLKERYRISDDLYIMGLYEGAIAALNMVYRYDIFKGALLFSPSLKDTSQKLLADLNRCFKKDKAIYIYHGEKDYEAQDNSVYYVSAEIKKHDPDKFLMDLDPLDNSNYDGIERHIKKALDFIANN